MTQRRRSWPQTEIDFSAHTFVRRLAKSRLRRAVLSASCSGASRGERGLPSQGDRGRCRCRVLHAPCQRNGNRLASQIFLGIRRRSDRPARQIDRASPLQTSPILTTISFASPSICVIQRAGRGKSQLQRWQDWVAKWTAAAKKKKRTLSIELWGKSELVERLGRDSSPLYSGRATFWFDETILTPAWFQGKFEQARAGASDSATHLKQTLSYRSGGPS